MKHLPLLIAVFLILVAGFLANSIGNSLTTQAVYSSYSGDYGQEVPYRIRPSMRLDPDQTVPLGRLDFNKDGVINKDDVREHNNYMRRCVDSLWSPWCVPELDIDGNGRYEYKDNAILYGFITNPVTSGLSLHQSDADRTDDCELGRIRCFGDKQYSICGNYDKDAVLEWSDPIWVDKPGEESGKECRYGKIVTTEFEEDY
jgi:hypothetical protein